MKKRAGPTLVRPSVSSLTKVIGASFTDYLKPEINMLNEKFNPSVTLVTIKASVKEILNLNSKAVIFKES